MENVRRKAFECDTCKKQYTRRSGLKQHTRIEHGGENPKYKCVFCEKGFSDLSNRNRHQRIIHVGLKKYDCDICGEAFTFKWLVDGHKREHHGIGEKKRCACGKEFSFNSNYYAHQRICPTINPTPSNTFTCQICRKKYKTKQYLKKHIKYDHTNAEQFVCEECGENFTRPWSLERHKRRKHQAGNPENH